MESPLDYDINDATNKLEKVSIEDLQSRHRKERKELQARIQALKKNAPRSDKKKRKEALEEITKLEADLDSRQELEIKEVDQVKYEHAELTQAQTRDNFVNIDVNHDDNQYQQRVTKAQKRRDKKAREARRKEEELKELSANVEYGPKSFEELKIKTKLKERQLALFHIPSDGDCLYNAVRHQLLQHGLAALTITELRNETANYLQANKNTFKPYMIHPDSGCSLTDDQFQKYCDDTRNTSSWGGQVELKALSSILKVPIEVVQADGTPTVLGGEFGGVPLVTTYHRHLYSLGEHYNSTVPLADIEE